MYPASSHSSRYHVDAGATNPLSRHDVKDPAGEVELCKFTNANVAAVKAARDGSQYPFTPEDDNRD
jgi:hypothetical protein